MQSKFQVTFIRQDFGREEVKMYNDSLEPQEEIKPVEEIKERFTYVEVKVIRESDESALVEYKEKGMLQRVTVPLKVLIDDKVKDIQLKKGIPFGIDWSDIDIPKVTPQMLTQALRTRGIWSAADVRANPQAVRNAISQVQGELFSQIVQYISSK
jgi:uncharacterized protein YpuA (DUF1002 family)